MPRTPNKPVIHARKPRRDWRPAFLAGFAESGTVKSGCLKAGISRWTAYNERQKNETFALAWHDVEEDLTDRLESKAVELAMAGDVKLIEFLLKARKPAMYRERHLLEHTGAEGGPIRTEITVDAKERSDAAREYLARIAADES
jgi:hypothetical protein